MSQNHKYHLLPEWAANEHDPKELSALGGVEKLLSYYQHLVDSVNATSSDNADKYKPIAATRLRAGMKFLFGMANLEYRAEYASVAFNSCAPLDKRKELAARADALIDSATTALKRFDFWDSF